MELGDILTGIFTAAILIFLRSANVHAQRQKIVSTRLDSYLRYWNRVILDKDWFGIFYVGVKWNEEIRELVANGGTPEDIVKLDAEKKKIIEEFKEQLKENPSSLEAEVVKSRKHIKQLPESLKNNVMSLVATSSQNIIEGKTFISDEDASHLDPYMASVSIDLKMKLVNLMGEAAILFAKISHDPDSFKIEEHSDQISELLWQGILISKDIDTLSERVKKYTEKSAFSLTLMNVGL
ncbi:MAG: hypothetical protein JXR18_14855 [Neptuniibacter sp.]